MINVLIVDDDPIMLKIMQKIIPWNKYHMKIVGNAYNGKEAIEFLKMNRVDIIFTDIKMPHMDGIELIRHVHEFMPSIIFVVLSSYSDFQLVRESFKYGATDYMLKIDIDNSEVTHQLLKKLENGIMGQSMQRDAYYIDNLFEKIDFLLEVFEIYKFKLFDIQLIDNRKIVCISEKLLLLKKEVNNFVFGFYEGNIKILVFHQHEEGILYIQAKLMKMLEGIEDMLYAIGVSEQVEYENRQQLCKQIQKAIEGKFYREHELYFIYEERCIDEYYKVIQMARKELNKKEIENNSIKIIEIFEEIFSLSYAYTIDNISLIHTLRDLIEIIQIALADIYRNENEKINLQEVMIELQKCSDYLSLKTKCMDIVFELYKRMQYKFGGDLFFEISNYINNNYNNPALSLEHLQNALLCSRRNISKCLQENSNMHFKQYLNYIRIKHAKDLLQHTQLRVNEIAQLVGYQNTEHFSRLFSNQVGMSPSTFSINKR